MPTYTRALLNVLGETRCFLGSCRRDMCVAIGDVSPGGWISMALREALRLGPLLRAREGGHAWICRLYGRGFGIVCGGMVAWWHCPPSVTVSCFYVAFVVFLQRWRPWKIFDWDCAWVERKWSPLASFVGIGLDLGTLTHSSCQFLHHCSLWKITLSIQAWFCRCHHTFSERGAFYKSGWDQKGDQCSKRSALWVCWKLRECVRCPCLFKKARSKEWRCRRYFFCKQSENILCWTSRRDEDKANGFGEEENGIIRNILLSQIVPFSVALEFETLARMILRFPPQIPLFQMCSIHSSFLDTPRQQQRHTMPSPNQFFVIHQMYFAHAKKLAVQLPIDEMFYSPDCHSEY